ncbi:MAG: hypothetical protein EOS23_18675 [Mesorhizobium sp.]|uniref:DUF6894 family protein n=1 Tax=unclassified Mesorhizobium TaxID=325217 RepID=UPI000FD53414|nr:MULTISPECIES: hypothetical protein [unclassified Mesorhizobium]RUV71003.1 hypothetical protein EOA88_28040 [Mesorhizobium sp. M5C.F.Ca.IN.020.14.1.1]RUV30319.1 hypothetical protein EOA86_11630 [Mesorhizobium sp. M5C.F.Ca.IN.020.32.2.1]RWC42488.1 MAG: hypothetical protein EOS28_17080 [Mesorhizobium sp.]RWD43994.1 MAG: hypothetical protein EOS59_24065 [Mesorhizobium sp.]RWE09469.1 MAG: hypothetical protein EOS23_18675 [Mesorhizobium sp.]
MPRFYFDWDESNELAIVDDIGLELPDLAAAKAEAAQALAEWSKNVIPRADRQELALTVRDEHGHPCLRTHLIFEAIVLQFPN